GKRARPACRESLRSIHVPRKSHEEKPQALFSSNLRQLSECPRRWFSSKEWPRMGQEPQFICNGQTDSGPAIVDRRCPRHSGTYHAPRLPELGSRTERLPIGTPKGRFSARRRVGAGR